METGNLKLVWLILLLLICVLVNFNCGFGIQYITSYELDVTHKKNSWGGYEPGQVYQTLADLFIMVDTAWGTRLVLSAPQEMNPIGNMEFSTPLSVTVYNADPDKWTDVKGVVELSTQLKIIKFLEHGTLFTGGVVHVFAEIMDGPFKGELVDIYDLSNKIVKEKEPIRIKPDSRLLKMVRDE